MGKRSWTKYCNKATGPSININHCAPHMTMDVSGSQAVTLEGRETNTTMKRSGTRFPEQPPVVESHKVNNPLPTKGIKTQSMITVKQAMTLRMI